jgi:hypothetical protein
MLAQRLKPLLFAGPALYLGIAAVRAGDTPSILGLLVAMTAAYGLSRAPEGADRRTARAMAITALGVSVSIAAAATHRHHGFAMVLRDAATAAASLAAIDALGQIDGGGGLAPRATLAACPSWARPATLIRIATIATAFVWLSGLVPWGTTDGATNDVYSTWTGAAVSAVGVLLLMSFAALLLGMVRRLELGARVRSFACAGVALGAAALVPLLDATWEVTASTTILASVASAVLVRLARGRDDLTLLRRSRRGLTLLVFGGPLVGLAALSADGHPVGGVGGMSAAILWSVAALVVGGAAATLEEPFLPERGLLLRALREARDAAMRHDLREAMTRALEHIRRACSVGLGPTVTPSPELWLFDPARVLSVDAAGYLREHTGEMPQGLLDLALGEPHKTVRTSVLQALEVQRADLRPMLAWLNQRNVLFATVVATTNEPEGLLLVPRGARERDASLEELRAAERLADALVAAVQATSATERHLERERTLQRILDATEASLAAIRHDRNLDAERITHMTERLARAVSTGLYSPASRMAFEALEQRLYLHNTIFIEAPTGVDPIPYVARAHASAPMPARLRPLVVVDGTASHEHDVTRWQDPSTSPLALAAEGLLCLVDGAALPSEVQSILGQALAHRRAPWDRTKELNVQLVLSSTRPLPSLLPSGELVPELADQVAAHEAIVLPRLRERPEDLSSLLTDRLAREGLRAKGRPVGIDASAFAKLIEYDFEGEDAELSAIVTRLVAHVDGDVIREADVNALELRQSERHRAVASPT